MEIQVGEYGRTNKGKIFIFAWLENSDGKRYTDKVLLGNGKIFENKFYYFDDGEEIVKHSKNIIDIIEVGDLVEVFVEEYFENGEKIEDTYVYEVTATNVKDFKGNRLNEIGIAGECGPELIPFENVKGIATREAFKKVEYEV